MPAETEAAAGVRFHGSGTRGRRLRESTAEFLREQGSRRTDPAKQMIKGNITMNEVVKRKLLLDGFQGFEDAVEGADSPANRLIQGQLVKFTNQSTFVTDGSEELPDHLELVAVNVTRVVQKWVDRQPIETIVLESGQKFPDIEKLNASVPQSEWREGPDGKLHGPWQAQYLVYLLNPSTAERYTYATGTVGGGIAVRDLVDRTQLMRKFRGENVYPAVIPSNTFMKTRFGGRQRPHFVIKRWIALGGGGALPATDQPALTGPQAVEPPTAKEARRRGF
jgi:hypothetical protein